MGLLICSSLQQCTAVNIGSQTTATKPARSRGCTSYWQAAVGAPNRGDSLISGCGPGVGGAVSVVPSKNTKNGRRGELAFDCPRTARFAGRCFFQYYPQLFFFGQNERTTTCSNRPSWGRLGCYAPWEEMSVRCPCPGGKDWIEREWRCICAGANTSF